MANDEVSRPFPAGLALQAEAAGAAALQIDAEGDYQLPIQQWHLIHKLIVQHLLKTQPDNICHTVLTDAALGSIGKEGCLLTTDRKKGFDVEDEEKWGWLSGLHFTRRAGDGRSKSRSSHKGAGSWRFRLRKHGNAKQCKRYWNALKQQELKMLRMIGSSLWMRQLARLT